MQTSGGATLIEMLTAVTIIAVVGAAAIPAFGELRRDAERNDVVNRLYHALYLARSESLTRGEVVSVCKSRDGVGCARGRVEWGAGWIVFINADRDDPPERDADEAAIAVYSGWPHQSTMG